MRLTGASVLTYDTLENKYSSLQLFAPIVGPPHTASHVLGRRENEGAAVVEAAKGSSTTNASSNGS